MRLILKEAVQLLEMVRQVFLVSKNAGFPVRRLVETPHSETHLIEYATPVVPAAAQVIKMFVRHNILESMNRYYPGAFKLSHSGHVGSL